MAFWNAAIVVPGSTLWCAEHGVSTVKAVENGSSHRRGPVTCTACGGAIPCVSSFSYVGRSANNRRVLETLADRRRVAHMVEVPVPEEDGVGAPSPALG